MRSRHLLSAAIVLGGAAFVWAQVQTTTSQTGTGTATASARASGQQGASSSNSGGAAVFSTAKPTHAIIYSAGEKWIEGKPAHEQNLKPHADYMAGMVKKGILIFGGPWRDEPGGLAILKCRSDEEARAVLENDPAVKMGVMNGDLKAWTVFFQGPGIPMGSGPGAAVRPPQ